MKHWNDRRALVDRLVSAAGFALVFVAPCLPPAAHAQARPLPGPDVQGVYRRLLLKIERIKIFDHHAHPGYPDDPDVDAMAIPPSHPPLRLRDTNPELTVAAKALFDYPFGDFSPDHARWLIAKTRELRKAQGAAYFDHILDQVGIETSAANRVAMAPHLDPKRFRWVFFVDAFFFPFDNQALASSNPDEAVHTPMPDSLSCRRASASTSPSSLASWRRTGSKAASP